MSDIKPYVYQSLALPETKLEFGLGVKTKPSIDPNMSAGGGGGATTGHLGGSTNTPLGGVWRQFLTCEGEFIQVLVRSFVPKPE
jgi:hypothetical protein